MNIGIRKEEEKGINKVYANVILLDNKIIEWGIGQDKWEKESLGVLPYTTLIFLDLTN